MGTLGLYRRSSQKRSMHRMGGGSITVQTAVTLDDDLAEGEKVVSRWRAQGTHQGELMGIAPTGNEVAITGLTIHRIEDGKIVEEWENWDALGLMQQIGAVPAPEQSEEARPT